jgi:hypothetical protein
MIDEDEIFAEILAFVQRGFEVRIRTLKLAQGVHYEIQLTEFRKDKVFILTGIDLQIKFAWERVKSDLTMAIVEGRYDDWKNTETR